MNSAYSSTERQTANRMVALALVALSAFNHLLNPSPSTQVSRAPALVSTHVSDPQIVPSNVFFAPFARATVEAKPAEMIAPVQMPAPVALGRVASFDPITTAYNKELLQKANFLKKLGISYDLYGKKGMNCSMVTSSLAFSAMNHVNAAFGKIFDVARMRPKLIGTSENQILLTQSAPRADQTLYALEHRKLGSFSPQALKEAAFANELKPGMLVGVAFNTYKQSFGIGRTNNITHLGTVVVDHGVVSIIDCSEGANIRIQPLRNFVETLDHVPGGARFYVGSPMLTAANEGAPALVETALEVPAAPKPSIQTASFVSASTKPQSYRTSFGHHHRTHHTQVAFASPGRPGSLHLANAKITHFDIA